MTETGRSIFGIVFYSNYFKIPLGILQLLELVIGIICMSMVAHHISHGIVRFNSELFFLLTTTTFLINTFILILSYMISDPANNMIAKLIYEFLYYTVAVVFYLIASIVLAVCVAQISKFTTSEMVYSYNLLLSATIFGFTNTLLYSASATLAFLGCQGP